MPEYKFSIPQRPFYSTKRMRQTANIRIAKPTIEERKEINSIPFRYKRNNYCSMLRTLGLSTTTKNMNMCEGC